MTKREPDPWLVLGTLLLGLFVMGVGSTSVNTAVPSISDDLGATFDQLLWVINIYTLVLAVLVITAGRLGDLYGPKRLFIIGMTVFTAASIACGLAQTPVQLIAARFVQAIGGALVSPQSLSMISKVFPPERRGAAMGVWGATAGAAVAIGPSIGGLIVSAWGWRWIFLVNVPICLLAIVLAAVVIPSVGEVKQRRLDLVGSALASAALFLITYGLIEGKTHDWGTVWGPVTIPMVIGAGLVALVAFIVVERGRQDREPLLPLVILRDRNFSVMAVVTITLVGGVGAMLLLLSIYLQSALGLTAFAAGLVMAIAPAVSIAVSPISGRMTDKHGGKPVLIVGLVLFAAGLLHLVVTAEAHSSWWNLLPGLILVGVAMGVTFAPPLTIAMHDIDPSVAGAASGTLNTIRQFGATIGAAAVGALAQSQLAGSLRDSAAGQAAALEPRLREPFLGAMADAADGGLRVGRGDLAIDVPPGLSDSSVDALRAAAQSAFETGMASAVRATFLLPACLLVLSILLMTLVRRPRPAPEPLPTQPAAVR
ncbi:MFS transporter [Actinokineospora sp. HUAS TT18]|uniref:MFS transporter n=1 Tax=Actinokineospora sp. HUAS TT18 TaxID=3447451 RepID=UPI003F51C38C